MNRYADCKYSAFISYAHADDLATGGWVSQFYRAFSDMLSGRLARQPGGVRPCHLSQENGPIAGELTQELLERVQQSFSMIIVVHENYVSSEWCLKELKFFRDTFGSDGFLERLYVLALSQESINKLVVAPLWKELVPPDQVWIPFFEDLSQTRPVNVFMAPAVLEPRFQDKLQTLVKDAADKIRISINDKPPPPFEESKPSDIAIVTSGTQDTRVIMGVVTEALADKSTSLFGDLCKLPNLQVSQLDRSCLLNWSAVGDLRSKLVDADCLILPFDDSLPLLPLYGAGGHLALQQAEWLALPSRAGRARSLFWVELADVRPPVNSLPNNHAEFIANIRKSAIDQVALLSKLAEVTTSASKNTNQQLPNVPSVRVYIESNPRERDEWRVIGRRIESVWQKLTATGNAPIPNLRIRGLPVDEIDSTLQRLDDADGVVLLWGQKDVAALREHINIVENVIQLDGPFPPGFVAYLMPPKPASGPQPAQEWPVVRFNVQGQEAMEAQEESADLQSFVSDILRRVQAANHAK